MCECVCVCVCVCVRGVGVCAECVCTNVKYTMHYVAPNK